MCYSSLVRRVCMSVVVAVTFLSLSCSSSNNSPVTPNKEDEEDKKYGLVWSDEFEGTGKPDQSKWNYELGFPRPSEAQQYTAYTKNVYLKDGYLVLKAIKEDVTVGTKTVKYTSGSVITKGKKSWTYGKFEIKAKLPKGRGIWPAIWLLGENISKAGWPKCGEIDIMEHVGFSPRYVHATIHTQKYNHKQKTQKGDKKEITDPYDKFHIYAIEWTPQKIDFLLDGEKFFTFRKESSSIEVWPFDKPEYLILNVTVGGGWGGQQGIDDSIFPQQMMVDYVRVYQKK